MFLNHFALTTHPFAEKPPIEWLLRDERIDQAFNCHKTATILSIFILRP